MKLTKKQTNELVKHGYTPKSEGAFLDLYWDDFKLKEWEQVCDSLGVDCNVENITVAWIGGATGKIEEDTTPEPKLPDGLQKYIDGVGLNILYRNYHKSTNGIWSRAEIEFEHEDEQCNPYYEVNIDFGCQDDTRNEQYSQTMYFFKKGDEWTCTDDYCESCSCRGWIESNDEEGRDAIQRCDECKVFDTDEYAQKIYDQECKDYFNKEKV